MIEWALEFFDPDYLTMDKPHGRLRYQVMNERDARKAVEYRIPQGKQDYRVVCREVTEWKPADMEPHQVTFIGNDGHRQIKGTGAIPNE